jgi:predicted Zn-dependent protease
MPIWPAETSRAPRIRVVGLIAALAAAAMTVLQPVAASAQSGQGGVTIIRDAEIEQLMRDYARPVFGAAGLGGDVAKIILVGSRDFNAFVTSGRRVFINVGVLMEAATPNQVIGVLAHEAGHIQGGHLFRLRQQLEVAQVMAIAGMLLGAGAVAAGSRSSQVGMSGTGPMGAITGPMEMARRSVLAYQRAEEQAADKAAVRYLNATGQSSRGLIETFQRFADDSLFRRVGSDPYLQSHPSAPERISALKEDAERSPHFGKADPPALKARHEMARAKIVGFLMRPEELARRYPPTDTSLPARYARAISAYRFNAQGTAHQQIDALIAQQPNNPFFYELKGQALLEAGRPREALAPLRRAISLAPGQLLFRGMLGHALVSTGDVNDARTAIRELTTVTQREPDAPDYYQYLSRAYGAVGDEPMAALSAAQGYILSGQREEARRLARRARNGLKQGSPAWQKADEILNQPSQT